MASLVYFRNHVNVISFITLHDFNFLVCNFAKFTFFKVLCKIHISWRTQRWILSHSGNVDQGQNIAQCENEGWDDNVIQGENVGQCEYLDNGKHEDQGENVAQ